MRRILIIAASCSIAAMAANVTVERARESVPVAAVAAPDDDEGRLMLPPTTTSSTSPIEQRVSERVRRLDIRSHQLQAEQDSIIERLERLEAK